MSADRRKGARTSTAVAVAALLGVLVAASARSRPPLEARGSGQAAGDASRWPRLVVFLVVDQMRADYVDRFGGDWTQGLRRLLDQGARFSQAAYPFLGTVTCAGHATVATGAFPRTHGVPQNAWFDREARRQVTCTEDPNVHAVGYGVAPAGGDSSGRLLLPTFADEMRRQRGARVVTLSLKARSAIMLAGRAGDAVTWLAPSLDGWQTSSAFSQAPVAAVRQFVDAAPIAGDYRKAWTPLLPVDRYRDPEAGDGEAPPAGWTPAFPHVLSGASSAPDEVFYDQWQHSPFADAYLGRFAAALAESLELGRHEGTDVLGVGFSTPDLVGHAFGPRSREVQDTYARLDQTIGALLDRLDALVGRNQYIVALASDHGVAEIPEQLRGDGRQGGRLSLPMLRTTIDSVAQAAGPGKYVTGLSPSTSDVYFEPGMYDRLAMAPTALTAVVARLERQSGIARVFRADQLLIGANAPDRLLRAAALSYVPRRSGDLVLVLRPGWMYASSGTTHGTAHAYDQRVPMILMGPHIKPGEYREDATPADIAPTLAALSGIAMPQAEGRVLRSALTATPSAEAGRR